MMEHSWNRNSSQGAASALRDLVTVEAVHQNETATKDLVCTHDLEGRILSVNAAVCDVLGLSAEALLHVTIQKLLPAGSESGFATYIQSLRRAGFAVGTMTLVTRDGSRRVWEYHNTLEVDETQTIAIVRGIARDVTDREEAFRAVRRSEEHFRSIIENASDVIAIIQLDGRIGYESPSVEHVLGYPCKHLVGVPFLDLIHADDSDRAAAFLARQMGDPPAVQTIELRVHHQDGSWRSFEIVAKNLVRRGQISAVVMNARDITERKLLEAQLEQANRLGGLGRLAATVAHEFNNVLMGMQPFAELLQRDDASPAMITKGASYIANSVQRGKRIVQDILRFTQPHVPIATAIDLGEWWESFAPEAELVLGNMITVVSTIPDRGLSILADRTQLSQVLANLVANARDAMSAGGVLTIGATHPGPGTTFPFGVVPHPERFVWITVRDTGDGMRAEVMSRIFEPLYTTRQSGGTGLGLAVAHQVMTQHGGGIFVESELGRGSTFHLFFPMAEPVAGQQDAAAEPARRPAVRKVLIIEDEQPIAEGIVALLETEGIEVEAISSGSEAARAVSRFQPDLIVLDYGLPGMDGSEVYARIRAMDRSIPIIFATGHGDRRVLYDDLHDSRTRFLQKPFEGADLLRMMVDLESEPAP